MWDRARIAYQHRPSLGAGTGVAGDWRTEFGDDRLHELFDGPDCQKPFSWLVGRERFEGGQLAVQELRGHEFMGAVGNSPLDILPVGFEVNEEGSRHDG